MESKGWTTTKKLGIEFQEIVLIFIGDCGSKDEHYNTQAINTFAGGAHTHLCPDDPLYKAICVSDKKYLLNSDGTPSELLVHELAHVVTPWKTVKCEESGKHSMDVSEDFRDGHGPKWEQIMKAWDRVPSLYVNPPY